MNFDLTVIVALVSLATALVLLYHGLKRWSVTFGVARTKKVLMIIAAVILIAVSVYLLYNVDFVDYLKDKFHSYRR